MFVCRNGVEGKIGNSGKYNKSNRWRLVYNEIADGVYTKYTMFLCRGRGSCTGRSDLTPAHSNSMS